MNIRRAEVIAVAVWTFGGVAICPHKNTSGFGGVNGLGDEVWLEGDKALLRVSDALVTVPGWGRSEGAVDELKLAQALGLPILHTVQETVEFLYQHGADMNGYTLEQAIEYAARIDNKMAAQRTL